MRARFLLLVVMLVMISAAACEAPGTPGPPGPEALEPTKTVTPTVLADQALPTASATLAQPAGTPTVVYIDSGNLWLIVGTHPPQQLTDSGNAHRVRLSSDGQKVAFTTLDADTLSSELRLVNSDGSGETVLLSQAQLDALYPPDWAIHHAPHNLTFIPRTHTLLFTTKDLAEAPGLWLHEDLVQVDTATGAFSIIIGPGDGGTFLVSPDGERLAITRPNSISMADVDGSNQLPNALTYPEVPTDSELIYRAAPVWAPDSSAVGVAIPSPIPFGPGVRGSTWRIPSDGSTPIQLATIEGKFFSLSSSAPFISPDLSRVAFYRETDTFTVFDLYVANSDGTEETPYATDVTSWEGWAPDSEHFVYATGAMDLYLGLGGAAPVPLGAGRNLRWMTKHTYLYLSGSGEAWTLMQGQLGSDPTPLVGLGGDLMWVDYDFAP